MSDLPVMPAQLWKQLDADRKAAAAEAFWRDETARAEQAEALALIAQRIKFRLKSVQAMPLEKKTRQLVSLPAISEIVAARALVSYHLVHQRPMMSRFLDALGVKHEDGVIEDEELTPPSVEQVTAAAAALDAFPADDVWLYFSTLLWQDPDTWKALRELPQVRSRLDDAPSPRA